MNNASSDNGSESASETGSDTGKDAGREAPGPTDGVGESWSTYWRGADGAQAWSAGGSAHPRVLAFWQELFAFARDLYRAPLIADIAGGSGALTGVAREVFDGGEVRLLCLDVSAAAVHMAEQRFPGIEGVVADARALPLDDASCEVVASQFGIEYAGTPALDEALRVVGERGLLAVLAHYREGLIHARCRASRDAVAELRASAFAEKARAMFAAGFAALSPGGDPEAYRQAGRDLAPAIRRVEQIMASYGREVADSTIVRLYRDVRDIHANMDRYERADVLDWLARMETEIHAYHGRMASMCEAAIDEQAFVSWCERVRSGGFDLLRAEALAGGAGEAPLGWVLVARRR